jgi:competence ComEA-like helix-hairpin-helix protein
MAFRKPSGWGRRVCRSLIILISLLITVLPVLGQSEGTLDLNRATIGQLQTLPSIGPVLAGRIVEYRTKHGNFKRTEDLIAVRGFSVRRYRQIAHLLRVTQP